ncbi:MAG: arabinogalactan endo-1,4-beta-galactosidase, partial [Bacilli bacterium]|nr:arabinogalactan endo-1,4-beta-galactosidase [Bacilli bacterium]
PSDYYDYAAISYYPYYCFDTMSDGSSILSSLNLSKPWFIAETSYPFSGGGYTDDGTTSFLVSNDTSSGITGIKSKYSFNSEGQANLIHDLTSAVVSAGGLGIFYWESAWIPNANVGWAGSGSANTWGNQGFFSFDGKAIANLDLFAQMSPHI